MCDPIDESQWFVAYSDFCWYGEFYRVELNHHELDVFARVSRLDLDSGNYTQLFNCTLVDLLPTFLTFYLREEADKEREELIDEFMGRP